MEFTVRINVKAVLAVLAVGALTVGSFFAGMGYRERKSGHPGDPTVTSATDPDPYAPIARPIKAGDTLVIANSEAADNEASWCKAHPNTNWTFAPATPEQIRKLNAQIRGGDAVITPISGSCDASGGVWVNDHK
jgi:hypothetical protein